MSQELPQKLTTKQRQAAELLAFAPAAKVAETLSLRRETLSRWKKNPRFVAECERYRAERFENTRQRFQDVYDSLLTHLISGMKWGEDATPIALALLKHFGPHAAPLAGGAVAYGAIPLALPAPASALPCRPVSAEVSAVPS